MGRKHLTDNEKGQILGMHRVGTRVVEIAKMLKCHRTTIDLARSKSDLEDANPETRGRPSKFTPRISRIIRRYCIVNPGDSARVIKRSNNLTMSERSIQRFLVKNDFKARMTRPCMDISEVNRNKRVAWCERFQSKPLEY